MKYKPLLNRETLSRTPCALEINLSFAEAYYNRGSSVYFFKGNIIKHGMTLRRHKN
jgi:hypothetical protein